MAWASAELSSTLLTLMAADKPIMLGLGANKLLSPTSLTWLDSGGSSGVSATYPTSRAYDYYAHKDTRPSSATTEWNLRLTPSAVVTFDSVAILQHNFGTITGLTVDLQIADDAGFTSNVQTIKTWSPGSSNKRLVSFSLYHTGANARSYSSVPYVRLHLTKGSSFTPQIGEWGLGVRRQLKHNPNIKWDPSERKSDVVDFKSASGVVSRYSNYKNSKAIKATINPHESSYQSDVTGWFKTDTDGGTKPFLWSESPTTDPQSTALMLLNEPRLSFPWAGPVEREVTISAFEQGPQFVDAET